MVTRNAHARSVSILSRASRTPGFCGPQTGIQMNMLRAGHAASLQSIRTVSMKEGEHWLDMVGFPHATTDEEIINFFGDFNVKVARSESKDWLAHIQFESEEDKNEARERLNREYIGSRYIELKNARGSGGMSFVKKDLPTADSQIPEGCTTLFIGNLPRFMDQAELKSLFEECGSLVDIRIPKDDDTGRLKGFAFVEFEDQESVTNALELQGTEFGGRVMNIDFEVKR